MVVQAPATLKIQGITLYSVATSSVSGTYKYNSGNDSSPRSDTSTVENRNTTIPQHQRIKIRWTMATDSVTAIWIFCSLAVVIMAIRLILGRVCRQKFDTGDLLTVAAVVFSVARIAFTNVIIILEDQQYQRWIQRHASIQQFGDLSAGDGK